MAYGASGQAFDNAYSPGKMVPMKQAVVKIWKGSLLDVNAAGYADVLTDTHALVFAGVAAETSDNRYLATGDSGSGAASAGTRTINVWTSGVFEFKIAAAEQDDVGKVAFCQLGSADAQQTVKESTDGTHPVAVGRIVEYVSATRVRVRIDGFAAGGSGAAPNGTHS